MAKLTDVSVFCSDGSIDDFVALEGTEVSLRTPEEGDGQVRVATIRHNRKRLVIYPPGAWTRVDLQEDLEELPPPEVES